MGASSARRPAHRRPDQRSATKDRARVQRVLPIYGWKFTATATTTHAAEQRAQSGLLLAEAASFVALVGPLWLCLLPATCFSARAVGIREGASCQIKIVFSFLRVKILRWNLNNLKY